MATKPRSVSAADAAPTIGVIVDGADGRRHIVCTVKTYDEMPPVGTELIARPAKGGER